MDKLLIFGGTTEGRELAEFCVRSGIPAAVSVATAYGAALLPDGVEVLCGRLDAAQIGALLNARDFRLVIDATHPYAREASANIRIACDACQIPDWRLLRSETQVQGEAIADMDALIDTLSAADGSILSTLGSKSLEALTRVRDFRERLWVRVLPTDGILAQCRALGYDASHVLAEKPPFLVADNLRHIALCGASILVTKESGSTGGYPEKCEAARITGIRLLTLCRPAEDGLTFAQIEHRLLAWRDSHGH